MKPRQQAEDANKLKENKIIDSHSSALTNQRLFYLFQEIDRAGIIARTALHLDSIMHYFGCSDQAWVDVEDVVTNKPECKKAHDNFVELYRKILVQGSEKGTPLMIFDLLTAAIEFNRALVAGLQRDLNYFFRVSFHQSRGLPHASKEVTNNVGVA